MLSSASSRKPVASASLSCSRLSFYPIHLFPFWVPPPTHHPSISVVVVEGGGVRAMSMTWRAEYGPVGNRKPRDPSPEFEHQLSASCVVPDRKAS